MDHPITGVLAASLTPLSNDGESIDDGAVGALCDFYAAAGLDGVLAMGTTGEGVLFDVRERRHLIDLFVGAGKRRLKVVAHCGAQNTRETVALAAHAADAGADGVAVISPPYFVLDEESLFSHLAAAAEACAPLPFYIYEFAARSGYPVPLRVIARLRERVENLAGLKVSDTPWEKFEPYLVDGLSIFVGPEKLIAQGMARGAVGAVSALAAALPELVLAAVRSGAAEASERCFAVREQIQQYPFHSALKSLLAHRGVAITDGVRRPLRSLSDGERREFAALSEHMLADLPAKETVR